MSDSIIRDTSARMKKVEQAYVRELGGIRAGRANPSLLNRVTVDYYGAPTPLNQIAQIAVPEARVLLITPYDKSALGDIEKALNVEESKNSNNQNQENSLEKTILEKINN